MAYLFDTDAISEMLRPRPLSVYVDWLNTIPREEQFTSAIVTGELYKGAYRSEAQQHHLTNIEHRILPAVTALPYDMATAILPDADLQIAATAIYHGLELVSGNLRHFSRIKDLKINPILANARSDL
jgi:predicted nucleic acid-binding protein